jgi:hypothetical protein
MAHWLTSIFVLARIMYEVLGFPLGPVRSYTSSLTSRCCTPPAVTGRQCSVSLTVAANARRAVRSNNSIELSLEFREGVRMQCHRQQNDIRAAAVVPAPSFKERANDVRGSILRQIIRSRITIEEFRREGVSSGGIVICEAFPYVCLLRAEEVELFSVQAGGFAL